MQVPIIVFHPVFGKYLGLARDCCPDAQTLKFTKKLVETAKWYFKNEVNDFIPIMQKTFQKYLVGVAGLSSIGDGQSFTDFSMQVMCLMSSSCIRFCKSMSTLRCVINRDGAILLFSITVAHCIAISQHMECR